MPEHCAAAFCQNRRTVHTRARGITFHKFPKDKDVRKTWEVALRREGFTASDSSVLCSEHFKREDFDWTGQIVRLRDGVIPSIFPVHLQIRQAGQTLGEQMAQQQHESKMNGSSNLKTRLSNAERFPCTAPTINMDQHRELMDFLPKDYQYHVCRYTAVSQPDADHTSFEATVRMSLQTKEEILVWLKCMAVTWRVAYTRPTKGQKIIFKADYRCQHNTKPRETTPKTGRVSKNTDCPAKLKVTLVRTEVSHGQRSRSTDPHIPHYPTLVDISNIHNHNIHVVDAVLECAEIPDADQSWCGPTIAAIEELGSTETSEVAQDEQWDSMIKEFSAMVQSNEGFQGAASAFVKTFHRLKGNPSMLQSAMRMFGHYDGSSLVSKRALQRAANCAGSSIATQPASVTRRKVKLGGVRRVAVGRPTKNVATMDHRYSYPKGGPSDTDSLPQQ